MLANLKTYSLIGLAACLALTLVLLNRAWNEVAEKTAVIDSMHREAQAYKERSETTSKEIGDAFTTLVEQIQTKDTALNAARAKFGSCNVARGIGAYGVFRNNDPASEADGAESPDGAAEERVATPREFINDCAIDAAHVNAWRSWALKNELEIN